MSDDKLRQSWQLLEAALKEIKAAPENPLRFAALAKAFESTFEYVWKQFKREAGDSGLEVYSPRDALKAAAQLDRIDDLEAWNRYLNARNLSVHDYVGMEDAECLEEVRRFHRAVSKLLA